MGSNVTRDGFNEEDSKVISFTDLVIPINQSQEPWCPPDELSDTNGTCLLSSLGMMISAQMNLFLHNLGLPLEKDSLPIRRIFPNNATDGTGTDEYIKYILSFVTIEVSKFHNVSEITPYFLRDLMQNYGPVVLAFEDRELEGGHAILLCEFSMFGQYASTHIIDPNYANPSKDGAFSMLPYSHDELIKRMNKDFYVTIYKYQLREDFCTYREKGLSVTEKQYLFWCLIGKIGANRVLGYGEDYKLPDNVNSIIKSYI